MTNQHYRAFGGLFFLLHQGKLLWLLNAPVIGRWFRLALRISGESSSVGNRRIFRIIPNAIFWWHGDKRFAEFRTHAKFSKRLYYAFRPLWWAMHGWDWCVADRWVPRWSFGFATLTKYPDANPETNTVDGYVIHLVATAGEAWANVRDGAGTGADDATALDGGVGIYAGTTSNLWRYLIRSIMLFDTSALTSGASISAATFSIYGQNKVNTISASPVVNVYTSNPASDTALVGGDYDSLGTTPFCDTGITYAGYSTTGYNNFALNADGLAAISKTGISKFGTRDSVYDVGNTPPTWGSAQEFRFYMYFADQGGETNDPKLVVTYVLEITPPVGSLSASGIAPRNDRGIYVPTEVDV
jgi:hypothetical protein